MQAAYDQLNPWGSDYDYWLALARYLSPRTTVDLGCGTGQLTVLLAQHSNQVIGIDPDPEMLTVARTRPKSETVTWVEGYAEDLQHDSANLVTMTSHVSQVFLSDADWAGTLSQLHEVLQPHGTLAFDMRNPNARGWEAWNPTDSRQSIQTEEGPAEQWHEVTDVSNGLVSFTTRRQWLDSPRMLEAHNVLRFRDESELQETLSNSGFRIDRCDGDWNGAPARWNSPELIVTAKRID